MNNPYFTNHICVMQQQEDSVYKCTDYMARSGSVVRPSDRVALCDWGYQSVAACNGASRTTAVEASSYFDRFLSTSTPAAVGAVRDIQDFQLAYVTCLVIALKVNSGFNVESDFVSNVVCSNIYDAQEINDMEMKILQALEWRVTGPTPHDFIDYFLESIPSIEGAHLEYVSKFSKGLTELAFKQYSVALRKPSAIAFTSICCALYWSEYVSEIDTIMSHLQLISGFDLNDADLRPLFKAMMYLVRQFLFEYRSPSPSGLEVSSVASEESPTCAMDTI